MPIQALYQPENEVLSKAFSPNSGVSSVYDLKEQFSHCCIGSHPGLCSMLQNCFSRKDLRSHSCRVCHTGTSDCLYQCFLDNTVFYVQCQLTSTLLRSTPAHTMSQTGTSSLFCFYLSLLLPIGANRDLYPAATDTSFLLHVNKSC